MLAWTFKYGFGFGRDSRSSNAVSPPYQRHVNRYLLLGRHVSDGTWRWRRSIHMHWDRMLVDNMHANSNEIIIKNRLIYIFTLLITNYTFYIDPWMILNSVMCHHARHDAIISKTASVDALQYVSDPPYCRAAGYINISQDQTLYKSAYCMLDSLLFKSASLVRQWSGDYASVTLESAGRMFRWA